MLVVCPSNTYDIPNRGVSKRFIRILTEELDGVVERKWNSESTDAVLLFSMVIQQRTRDVKRYKDSMDCMTKRMARCLGTWRV